MISCSWGQGRGKTQQLVQKTKKRDVYNENRTILRNGEENAADGEETGGGG